MAQDWHRDRDNSGDPAADAHEERVGAILNEFFDRQQRGEAISTEAFVAAHPEYADDLRRHFEGLRILRGLGGSSNNETLALNRVGAEDKEAEVGPGGPAGSDGLPEFEEYQILREVGRGGMGVVFKAIQRSTKRVVALKVLMEGPFASEAARRRFEREIELAAQLKHSNIVPIYDSGRAAGRMFYAMEYVHGRPLDEYLRHTPHSRDEKLRLFLRICAAVGHAHFRGVIHRDLKPANILVDGEGEPHVLDFGLAKVGGLQDTTTSVTAQIIGTPAYMAPEQVSGDPTASDPRTDVYTLGVILYEMLTGTTPYPIDVPLGDVLNHITQTAPRRPSLVQPDLRGDPEVILLKALAKRKDERYQSVAALAEDVSHYLAGDPISATRPSTLYLIGKALWPHRYMATAVGVIVLLVIVGSALLIRAWTTAALREQQRQSTELELARSRLAEQSARLEASQQTDEAVRRREAEWVASLLQRAQQASPDVAKAFKETAEDFLKSVGHGGPRAQALQLLGSSLEQAAQIIDRSTSNLPATQPVSGRRPTSSRPAGAG